MKKKKIQLVIIAILLIVLFGVAIFFSGRNSTDTSDDVFNNKTLEVTGPITQTGLDLALEMVPFLEDLEADDGSIYLSKDCQGKLSYSDSQFALKTWALLAYASLYDATSDSRYVKTIQSLEQDIITLAQATEYSPAMGHQLHMAYQLLKGKDILQNENDIVNIIAFLGLIKVDDSPDAFEGVQPGSMISGTIASVLLDEIYLSPVISKKFTIPLSLDMTDIDSRLVTTADGFLKHSESFLEDSPEEVCWTYLSHMILSPYDEGSKAVISSFLDGSLSTSVYGSAEGGRTPVEVQPCAEVYLLSYQEDGDMGYIQKASAIIEYINSYGYKTETCYDSAISSEGLYNFVDNAYQVYLLASPGLREAEFEVMEQ